jgi:tetratricopeptide (TPR) repeat protein
MFGAEFVHCRTLTQVFAMHVASWQAEKKRQEELNLSDKEDDLDRQEAALAAKTQGFIFTMRQRRGHFKRKIFALEKEIRDLKRERQEIDAYRTKCTLEMRQKEALQRSYKLEIERLRQYTGATVTSSVLAGFSMQYKTEDYARRIEKAHSTCMEEIATMKYQVITGENRRAQAKVELEAAELARQERTARFHEFEQEYQRKRKVLNRLAGTEVDSGVLYARYFKLLREHMGERKAQRRKIADTFMAVIARYLKSAFEKWRYGEFRATSSHDTVLFTSKGGVMLAQAAEKRAELQNLLREAISGTAAIKQKIDMAGLSRSRQQRLAGSQDFKGMEEGIDHADLYHVRGLKMLYEGDGYAKMNKFNLARDMYEAQVMWIRSRPQTDIKLLAICHGRLGKMFLNLGKQNRAIVEFDRQLSLAKEVSDKPEQADAYFGLGAGYLANYDYENAVRYLNIAQTLLNGLGSAAKYSGALRALKDCYERMDRQDKALICAERIAEIESELSEKIALANFKISDMKSRLVHTAAEIEHIVNIERTTFRAMSLRAIIGRQEILLEGLEKELGEQQLHCGALAMLLDAIDKELAEAAACDEREMWSVLVHDQPQIVEVEELKIRLAGRKKMELANLEQQQLLVKTLQVKIKNAENEIAGADEQLALEEGPLMKHSRLDRPFRSVGLCAANAAGNEVTGTGTGGYEEFAAAEGMHIHMIDYHSGSVNHVYMGGSPDLGHTGVVTCVLHDGKLVFSGSTDETIIAWDTSEARKRVRTFIGHEGSIVSLAVEGTLLASGGSDSTLRLWDKHTGQQLRIVYGHSRSVLSIEIGKRLRLRSVRVIELTVVSCVCNASRPDLDAYRLYGHRSARVEDRQDQARIRGRGLRVPPDRARGGRDVRALRADGGAVRGREGPHLHLVDENRPGAEALPGALLPREVHTVRLHPHRQRRGRPQRLHHRHRYWRGKFCYIQSAPSGTKANPPPRAVHFSGDADVARAHDGRDRAGLRLGAHHLGQRGQHGAVLAVGPADPAQRQAACAGQGRDAAQRGQALQHHRGRAHALERRHGRAAVLRRHDADRAQGGPRQAD